MAPYFKDYIDVREDDEVQNGPNIPENRYFKLIGAFFDKEGFVPDGTWKYGYRGGNGFERIYISEECGEVVVHVSGAHLRSLGDGKSKVKFSTHIKFDPNVKQPWRHNLSFQGGFLAGIKDLEKRIEE
jgi:hypothetical protein